MLAMLTTQSWNSVTAQRNKRNRYYDKNNKKFIVIKKVQDRLI